MATSTRQFLLAAGVVAPLLWIGADLAASALYEGYSFTSMAPSELSAIGAPTRSLLTVTGFWYEALVVLFGIGVAASPNRSLRVAGIVMIAWGLIIGIGWTLSPMHMRGAERTVTDTMHQVMAALTVAGMLLYIGFGAAGMGRAFRIYSAATALVMLVFGFWTARFVPLVAAQLPTPGMGLIERIGVYAGIGWMLVFAVALLREASARRRPELRPRTA